MAEIAFDGDQQFRAVEKLPSLSHLSIFLFFPLKMSLCALSQLNEVGFVLWQAGDVDSTAVIPSPKTLMA